ncbi:UDP-N-acetylmuramyl-tripeptide synthetase [Limosilactobacillus sp. Sa3CUN2]|uniref:UDP-N-acetylmuramyl-tripeptide synthetase n=1 Tax=Limosilactobacillus avistercoris TaxID=2762243 RepID=A0ABR8PA17_9LACO|nr:UDP-N-acetylmuramyl-tripeptide synthetase [Limosilactobacillus avistercoris]MBD7894154.1 UDP-N-acetylmuramyl-tripeptide synthetase [Limosilactobacillus avistercoris]
MLTLKEITDLLKENGLYKEIIINGDWYYTVPENTANAEITDLSYDSRKISDGTLFFCKGLKFNPEYLASAIEKGATAAISELVYTDKLDQQAQSTPQIIVTDVQKSMAVIARHFYGCPDEKLELIGFTGTKGKTTSVYFTRHILAHEFGPVVGQFSSIDECVDGKNFIEAHLTTPESLDLFRMMREAVDNGMKYLAMEVSSQAYKKSRVYDLHFNIGVFLNISPDHISPVEHPTFDDYLWCKSQIIVNSDTVILNRDMDYYELLAQKAHELGKKLITFGSDESDADYRYHGKEHGYFDVSSHNDNLSAVNGEFRVMIPGHFNYSNALAAITVSAQLKDDPSDFAQGLKETRVPGRMEFLKNKAGLVACVDYAHNYLSLSESFKFMKHEYPDGRLIVVIGAAGGKAESRRKDVGRALSEYADVAILTSEDNFFEDPHHIDEAIKEHITNPNVKVIINVDRVAAIKQAFEMAKPGDAMFMAAKGREQFMHEKGQDIPYVGDYQLSQKLMEEYDK